MIVIAVIGILAAGAVVLLNPGTQFAKAHNAQRKNDLEQIKTALDTYYSDYNHYPGQMSDLVSSYMAKLPKDPLSPSQDYSYEAPADGSWYRLYANLERCSDSQNTIGVDCLRVGKNYSINSSNLAALNSIPTPTPTLPPKTIFVSSQAYNGNLGGLSGADAKCQALAAAAGMTGTYKVWLSDSATSAKDRLVHSGGIYKKTNGTVIANNWSDLTDGSLGSPINFNENGLQKTDIVIAWTNTRTDGSLTSSNSCTNWTNSDGAFSANIGGINRSDVFWTSGDPDYCDNSYVLYCVEQ